MSDRLKEIALEADDVAKSLATPRTSGSMGIITAEERLAEVVAKLTKELAMHPPAAGVQGPTGAQGPAGPPGPPGPSGAPGRGLDDLAPAGRYRAKLQGLFEQLVAAHAEAREAGMSTRARRALKKARRYLIKAIGGVVAEDETEAGRLMREERALKKAEKAEKAARGSTGDDGEEEDEEQDPDDSSGDLGDDDDPDDEGEEPDDE